MAAPGLSDHDRPGTPVTDLSPEARRREALQAHLLHRPVPRPSRRRLAIDLAKRVVAGAWNDGFIHAGNLAYLSMLAIFPFFILGAAAFSLIGEPDEQMATIDAVLSAVPPVVGNVIGPVSRSVFEARSGWLLWGGGLVGLWTVGSLIETIRDILRRAYGTQPTHAFWKYRVFSTGIIVASVILLILSLIAQVIIGAAQAVIAAHIPGFENLLNAFSLSRVIPAIGLSFSPYLLFYSPARYSVVQD